MLDDYLKELTILNVFVYWKSRFGDYELITPPNDGCIYNGIIRRSIVDLKDQLLKEKGIKLIERQVSIHEIIAAHQEERMLEFFAGGVSSSVRPIANLDFKDINMEFPKNYEIANYFNNLLINIKQGSHPWAIPME